MTTDPQPTPENDPSQNVAPETEAASESAAPARPPRILIGSQRDLGAVRPAKKRDWYVPGEEEPLPGQPAATMPEPPAEPELSPAVALALEAASLDAPPVDPAPIEKAPKGKTHFPPPNIRDRLPPELEEELEASLGDMSLDDLMTGSDAVTSGAQLEPESKHAGRVIALGREEVFVELGSREQGTVPMRQFDAPPEVGDELTVAVVRFHQEDGLYELRRPGVAASVGDWSDIEEGTLVEARITGHNTGGLECEVNRIRGFIPVSQISLYR
ncbi:MAG TPA: hypothetical protein VJL29_11735, partial [Thermoguttaceae bacterium]|nr:hypothetical protein [Thermoguttaceae bacterium]